MANAHDEPAEEARAGTGAPDRAPAITHSTAHAYDFLQVPGGAERVSLHLLRQHPDWAFFTGFIQPQAFPGFSPNDPRVHSLGQPVRHPARQALSVMRAFARRGAGLAEYDQVLFSGVYAPVGVRHRSAGGNLYYCHTPPRFAYDLEDWYLERARAWERPALRRLAAHVRDRYGDAIRRMNRIAVNSETVRARLATYLDIGRATVIHPPVELGDWRWAGQEDFYLSNARVEPYKRVEWAVRAFMAMPDRRLVVASGGSDLARLQTLAAGHDNIRFTGWCDAAALRSLTGRCIATLYLAREEDFGLSPVESMAAGKPVIGIAEGGLLETVESERTGLLLEASLAEDVDALCTAVRNLDAEHARSLRTACEQRARRFAAPVFDAAIERFMAGEDRHGGPVA